MSIESLKQQARKHEQNEEWKKALDQYSKALQELASDDQVDIGLYNRVGDLHVRVGTLDQAVEHYEKAVELYREAYLPNNAIAVCKKIIRNVPERHRAYLVIGQIRAEQGFLPDARTNFLTYAERMQQAGDLDESFRALIEFCDLAPDDVGVRVTVAEQMAAHERKDEAVEQLLVAHRHYVQIGEADRAAEVAGQITAIDPDADVDALSAAGVGASTVGADGEIMADFGEISLGDDPFGLSGGGREAEISMEEAVEDAGDEGEDELDAGFGDFTIGSSVEEEPAPPLPGFDDDDEGEAIELPGFADDGDDVTRSGFADDEGDGDVTLPGFDDDEGEAIELPGFDDDEAPEDATPLPTMDFDDDDEPAPPLPGFDDDIDAGALPTMEIETSLPGEVEPGDAGVSAEEAAEPSAAEPDDSGFELRSEAPAAMEEAAEEVASAGDFDLADTEPDLQPISGTEPPVEPEPESTSGSLDDLTLAPEAPRVDPAPAPPTEEPHVAPPVPEEPAAAAPPPAPPAAEPAPEKPARPGGDEGFVDLGAMILGGGAEKSTRFTVAYEEPSGDEEADFARMLSQFKDKVSENLDSSDVRAHYDLGTAYKEMGLLDEAIGSFQAALRASADHLPTYELMGQTFIDMGKPEAAVKSLQRAVDIANTVEDELVGIYYYLGRAYEELDNKESAVEFYDRVFSLDINFADVTERLRELR